MTIPEPSWETLIVAVVSAAVGWLLNWLKVWQTPKSGGDAGG